MESILTEVDVPRYLALLDQFSSLRILVMGDIMVDQFIWGRVERISPEAPVPVVRVTDESFRLGGSANVVNNIRALGGKVAIAGIVGYDEMGKLVLRMLEEHNVDAGGIIISTSQRTSLKTRIIAHSQQVVRVDREDVKDIDEDMQNRVIDYVRRTISKVDGVVLSDYDKGLMTEGLVREIIELCKQHHVICAVDPKVKRIRYYRGCTIITPNHHEAAQATGIPIASMADMQRAGQALLTMVSPEAVLITYGEKGMVLFGKASEDMHHIDTVARAVFDVTGAGDTAISTLILALAAGASMYDAAVLANFAAGIVVGKVGTATVSIEEIKRELKLYVS